MIYPQIEELVARILERKKHIYLCTNGMFTRKKLAGFRPTDRFFWNVHLDGMEAMHDRAVEREGVFAEAIEGIKAAKKAGFLVCTNTTIYKETDMHEIAVLLAYLTELGVDGFMMSPYDARRYSREIPSGEETAGIVQAHNIAGLSRIPSRRARAALRRLGQPDSQCEGMEGPLLSDHRRPLRDASRVGR
jgi:MoaA/NifB/PqqE/SkfB family radical SAM enzyme